MKIRNGFVSNSSSSSFLIRTDGKYKTVYDVAKQIMKDMEHDVHMDTKYTEELAELENVNDKDTPVFFDTYDGGYIRKFKDYIIVSSTQHYTPCSSLMDAMINFSDIEEDYFKELEYDDYDNDKEYYDKIGEDSIMRITCCEDFDYYWKQFNDFLILKSGLYGVWVYDFDNKCADCNGVKFLKMSNGDKICRCKATKKYNRKLKLNNINKNEN